MKTYYLFLTIVLSLLGCTQEMRSATKLAELDSSSSTVSSEESSAVSSVSVESQLLDIEEAFSKVVYLSSSSQVNESSEYSSDELSSSSENNTISSVSSDEGFSRVNRSSFYSSFSLSLSQEALFSSSYMSSSSPPHTSSSSIQSSIAMSVSVESSSSSQPVQLVNTSPYFTQGSSLHYSFDEDTQVVFTLNAVDGESDTITWLLVENVSGQVVLSNEGNTRSVTYSPLENFHGTEQIQIQIEDVELSSVITINFEVLSVNDSAEYTIAPSITKTDSIYTINEGKCTDPDGPEQYTFNWFRDDDQSGFDGDSIMNAHERRYTLTSQDNNKYIYAQSICNAEDSLYSDYSDTIKINAPPVIAQGDTTVAVVDEGFDGVLSLGLSAHDPDPGAFLVWSIIGDPIHGSSQLTTQFGNSPTVDYAADTGYSGLDEIILQVTDGYLTDEVLVMISITPTESGN